MINSEQSDGTFDELMVIDHSLKALERKAELSAVAYLRSLEKVKRKSNIFFIVFLLCGIILSLISIMISIIFGDITNLIYIIGFIIAFMSITISIFSASDRIFGWNKEIADYDYGFKTYKRYSREIHWFRKSELPRLNEFERKTRAETFIQSYSMLVSALPPNNLSGKEFAYLKKEFELTKQANKELDKNPNCDLKKIFGD